MVLRIISCFRTYDIMLLFMCMIACCYAYEIIPCSKCLHDGGFHEVTALSQGFSVANRSVISTKAFWFLLSVALRRFSFFQSSSVCMRCSFSTNNNNCNAVKFCKYQFVHVRCQEYLLYTHVLTLILCVSDF